MYEFEEALRARDAPELVFLQAIRKTGDGTRTWVFFARSEQAFRELIGQEPRVSLAFARDAEWSQLSEILGRIRK
jgi:hypothetical protein